MSKVFVQLSRGPSPSEESSSSGASANDLKCGLILTFYKNNFELITPGIRTKIENNEDVTPLPRTSVEAHPSKNFNISNKTEDKKEQVEDLSTHVFPIKSFRQFVDLFYQKREGILYTHLYNSIKLISFKEGEIVINAEKISDPNFPRILARFISKWTGRIWTISTSNSNIGETLKEEDIINQQKEIEIMKNDPKVKEILNKFPGISIHSITPIGATVEEEELVEQKQIKGE